MRVDTALLVQEHLQKTFMLDFSTLCRYFNLTGQFHQIRFNLSTHTLYNTKIATDTDRPRSTRQIYCWQTPVRSRLHVRHDRAMFEHYFIKGIGRARENSFALEGQIEQFMAIVRSTEIYFLAKNSDLSRFPMSRRSNRFLHF